MDALVVTAIPPERDAVLQQLSLTSPIRHATGTTYHIGFEPDLRIHVAVLEAGMGNVNAATETASALERLSPKVVAFVGVAGGLKDVALGDVVVGTKVYGYESGKEENEFLPRPHILEPSYKLLQTARLVAREGTWLSRVPEHVARPNDAVNVVVAPIAAGEKVVASTESPTYVRLRKLFSDASAVEMEGFGFLRACAPHIGVEKIVVRGISDLVDLKDQADRAGWQDQAAAHAAAFTLELIAESLGLEAGSTAPEPTSTTDLRALDHSSVHVSNALFDQLWNATRKYYPRGPLDRHVWARAGGDVARVSITGDGGSDWYGALMTLRLGGGGGNITVLKLIQAMVDDFPQSQELGILAGSGESQSRSSNSDSIP